MAAADGCEEELGGETKAVKVPEGLALALLGCTEVVWIGSSSANDAGDEILPLSDSCFRRMLPAMVKWSPASGAGSGPRHDRKQGARSDARQELASGRLKPAHVCNMGVREKQGHKLGPGVIPIILSTSASLQSVQYGVGWTGGRARVHGASSVLACTRIKATPNLSPNTGHWRGVRLKRRRIK